jgi:protein-S-isoprenylcysteine O-methyltransferase Ste14
MTSAPLVEGPSRDRLVVRLRALVFAHRNALAAAPLLVALPLAEPAALARFGPALVLAGLGVALRAWATLHNRYAQGEPKTLATAGPYAWTRNPLYLANGLVLVGAATVAGPLWLVPLAGAWGLLVYGQAVRHEERRLVEKYGALYAAYRHAVPRWIAAPARWQARLRRFLPALFTQSRALLVLVPFALKSWLL